MTAEMIILYNTNSCCDGDLRSAIDGSLVLIIFQFIPLIQIKTVTKTKSIDLGNVFF